MWGNRLGWLISAVIVAALAGLFAWAAYDISRTTPPTEFSRNADNLAELSLPANLETLLVTGSRKNADGGKLYWDAIQLVRDNPDVYDNPVSLKDLDQYTALKPLLSATEYTSAELFRGRPEAVITYGKKPSLTALERIGVVCRDVGILYARQENYAEAQRYLTASWVLGMRMFQDRQCRRELDSGLGLMTASATNLATIARLQHNELTQKCLEDFHKACRELDQTRVKPMERVITSLDPKVTAEHVGDVFVLVQESKEKLWQVESVLRLGRYRFNSPLAGDRRAANRMIRELVKSSDPAIQAAAVAARDMTVVEYRGLAGN